MGLIIPADARSWVPVSPGSHFPIQNLPFGLVVRHHQGSNGRKSIAVRIGDYVLDFVSLAECGLLRGEEYASLDHLVELTQGEVDRLRRVAYDLLREDNPALRDQEQLCTLALTPISEIDVLVPVDIPAFVDFYSGIHHASNVGRMFRPDMPPLLPNYRHLPVAYNGRASSVIASGVPVRRPSGQTKGADDPGPKFGPTAELDFELELGFFLGEGNELGEPIPIEAAEEHMLGVVLVNDWSARDVQRWEYQPLGPFLAKSFATSISPWIVTLDALAPFRTAGPAQEPEVLPHLRQPAQSHFNIRLEVAIQTAAMRRPQVVCHSNSRHLYWSFAQQLAHLTSNGCNTEPGDLYASGTISGPDEGSFGSLLELTWRGQRKLLLDETGEERTFLEDGDSVIMSGFAQGESYRVGFGELRATVVG